MDVWLCVLVVFLTTTCGESTQGALDREESPLNTSELREVGATLTLQPGLLRRVSEREMTMLLPASVGDLTISADAVIPGNGALRMSFENGHRELVPEVSVVEQRALPSGFGLGCGNLVRTFDCAELRRTGATLPQLCSTRDGTSTLAYSPQDIEVAGTWKALLVNNTTWGTEEVVSFDNARNLAIVRESSGTFAAITWLEPTTFEALTSCRLATGLSTQAEAEAVNTLNVDTTSPASTGCNGSAWDSAVTTQSARLHYKPNPVDTTKFELSVQLRPCQTMYVSLEPPRSKRDEEVSFVVVGNLKSQAQFTAIVEETEPLDASTGKRPGTHDFYVLLGDALENQSAEDLGVLKSVIEATNVPTIVVLGKEESQELGTFTDIFGPFDFRWTLKGVQFLNLYSADQQLREQGLVWLETTLIAMQNADMANRQREGEMLPTGSTRLWPAFAFTHTPPYDVNPVREKGFVDRLQASRVMSLLATYGVDTVFAGYLRTSATREDTRPQVRVTSATGPNTLNPMGGEYLVVKLTRQTHQGARATGNRFISVTSYPAP